MAGQWPMSRSVVLGIIGLSSVVAVGYLGPGDPCRRELWTEGYVPLVLCYVAGVSALVAARRDPSRWGKRLGLATLLLGLPIFVTGPSSLRTHARGWWPEGWAVGEIRTLISAEAAYAASNGGFYDEIGCLAK